MNIVEVMRDENGNSRGFGFVSFEEHESAVKVMSILCVLASLLCSLNFYGLNRFCCVDWKAHWFNAQ